MINFSGISRSGLAGKLLRFPLRFLPAQMRMPILQGPLKGQRWIVGAGNHGYWLGSYESEMQWLYRAEIRPGDVIYDIGANVGFYTLLAAKLTGSEGRVFAFEPLPRNLAHLNQHLELNKVENVQVVAAAVADRGGEATFSDSSDPSMGHLSAQGSVKVKTVSLDQWRANEWSPPPHLIKIDVEGAEQKVLIGARQLLLEHRPIILLATHGAEVRDRCLALLAQADYGVRPIGAASHEEAAEFIARPATAPSS